MFLVFLNYFDMLMSKIIFFFKKNIINMKNYLKNNYNHIVKRVLKTVPQLGFFFSLKNSIGIAVQIISQIITLKKIYFTTTQ